MKRIHENEEEEYDVICCNNAKAIQVNNSSHFFAIWDEVYREYKNDKTSDYQIENMVISRIWLLDAYKEGRLYSLMVDNRYHESLSKKYIQYIETTYYYDGLHIPSLCIVSKSRKDTIELIWIAERARHRGFGSTLIKTMNMKYVEDSDNDKFRIKDGALSFFNKCNIIKTYQIRHLKQYHCTIENIYDYFNSHSLTYYSMEGDIEDSLNNNIHYIPIEKIDWDGIYNIMSDDRVKVQILKQTIYKGDYKKNMVNCDEEEDDNDDYDEKLNNEVMNSGLNLKRIYDHELYYGEICIGKELNVLVNKTMVVLRPYQLNDKEDEETILLLSKILKQHDLSIFYKPITYRDTKSWLILIMDTGINRDKAIEFACNMNHENTQ